MALHYRLGLYDWDEDRMQDVDKVWAYIKKNRGNGHKGTKVVHSGLTWKGKLRKLFRIKKGKLNVAY